MSSQIIYVHTNIRHTPLSPYSKDLSPDFSVVVPSLQFTITASCSGIKPLSM